MDIFLSPPADATESAEDENDLANGASSFWRATDSAISAKAPPSKSGMRNGRHASGKKPTRPSQSVQEGFLWG